jgi:hypothetical protein
MKLKIASAGTVGRNQTRIKLYGLEMKKSLKIQLLFISSKSNLPAVPCPPHGRQYSYLPVFLTSVLCQPYGRQYIYLSVFFPVTVLCPPLGRQYFCVRYLAHRTAGSTSFLSRYLPTTRQAVPLCSFPSPLHGRQYLFSNFFYLYFLTQNFAHQSAGIS